MSNLEVNRIMANVEKTLAVEGLKMSTKNRIYGKKYLQGQMSSEEAIKLIKQDILERKLKIKQ